MLEKGPPMVQNRVESALNGFQFELKNYLCLILANNKLIITCHFMSCDRIILSKFNLIYCRAL